MFLCGLCLTHALQKFLEQLLNPYVVKCCSISCTIPPVETWLITAAHLDRLLGRIGLSSVLHMIPSLFVVTPLLFQKFFFSTSGAFSCISCNTVSTSGAFSSVSCVVKMCHVLHLQLFLLFHLQTCFLQKLHQFVLCAAHLQTATALGSRTASSSNVRSYACVTAFPVEVFIPLFFHCAAHTHRMLRKQIGYLSRLLLFDQPLANKLLLIPLILPLELNNLEGFFLPVLRIWFAAITA